MKFRDLPIWVALREAFSLLWALPFGLGAGVVCGALAAGIQWPVFIVGGLFAVAGFTVLVLRWRWQGRERQRIAEAESIGRNNEAYWRANVDESK